MTRVRLACADCGGDSPSLTDTPTEKLPDSWVVPEIVSVPLGSLADSPDGSPDTAAHV